MPPAKKEKRGGRPMALKTEPMHSRASRQLALLVAALVVAVALPAEASAARYGSRTLRSAPAAAT